MYEIPIKKQQAAAQSQKIARQLVLFYECGLPRLRLAMTECSVPELFRNPRRFNIFYNFLDLFFSHLKRFGNELDGSAICVKTFGVFNGFLLNSFFSGFLLFYGNIIFVTVFCTEHVYDLSKAAGGR